MTRADRTRRMARAAPRSGTSTAAGAASGSRLRRLVAAAVVVVCLLPADAAAKSKCRTRECNARVAHRKCDQRHPRWCVEHVILHQRLAGSWKAAWLRRIPGCESTWDPYAVSPGGHSGLYQFAGSTWASTPYGHRSIFSAFWQPYAAAWMLGQGRVGEWACT